MTSRSDQPHRASASKPSVGNRARRYSSLGRELVVNGSWASLATCPAAYKLLPVLANHSWGESAAYARFDRIAAEAGVPEGSVGDALGFLVRMRLVRTLDIDRDFTLAWALVRATCGVAGIHIPRHVFTDGRWANMCPVESAVAVAVAARLRSPYADHNTRWAHLLDNESAVVRWLHDVSAVVDKPYGPGIQYRRIGTLDIDQLARDAGWPAVACDAAIARLATEIDPVFLAFNDPESGDTWIHAPAGWWYDVGPADTEVGG